MRNDDFMFTRQQLDCEVEEGTSPYITTARVLMVVAAIATYLYGWIANPPY
jgi:hypothetical protein